MAVGLQNNNVSLSLLNHSYFFLNILIQTLTTLELSFNMIDDEATLHLGAALLNNKVNLNLSLSLVHISLFSYTDTDHALALQQSD